jgi:hypothetical protein
MTWRNTVCFGSSPRGWTGSLGNAFQGRWVQAARHQREPGGSETAQKSAKQPHAKEPAEANGRRGPAQSRHRPLDIAVRIPDTLPYG